MEASRKHCSAEGRGRDEDRAAIFLIGRLALSQLHVSLKLQSAGPAPLVICVWNVAFIVVKAGVPIVADASKLGGDTPINPYFVSFLAIISGLMSEKGIASLRSWIAPYAIYSAI